jgi:type IV pilus assembly protein PilM
MAQRIVGLDIGSTAVRAVELTVSEGQLPILEAYGQVGLPPGAVDNGEIQDRAVVTAAIQRLWREGGFTGHQVNVGVAGLRAITRELDMPVLPPSELDNAVRYQADDVVPFPLERTELSSKVIAQYTDAEGAPTLRVLVAAAHRDLIDAVLAAVEGAGLEPVGIDLNTAALVRALHDPSYTAGPEAIISVGAGLTMVVVHEQGTLQFVRTIDMGGETMTKAMAAALDVPMADAEVMKRRLEVDNMIDDRARAACERAVDELVEEIRNSLRFFGSLPGRTPATRVLITGGGALSMGLGLKLEEALDVPVIPATSVPLVDTSSLPISPEQAATIAPILPVPVGLALPDPTGRPFNLLPTEVAGRLVQRQVLRYAVIGAGGLVLLMLALTLLQVFRVHNAQNSVNSLRAQNAYIQNVEIPKYDKVVVLKAEVIAQRAEIKPLISGEVDWLVVLNQMGQYTLPTTAFPSPSVWSTIQLGPPLAVASSPGTTTQPVIGSISGTVTAQGLPGVSDFTTSIGQSPAFVNVTPSGTYTVSLGGTVQFSMQIGVNSLAGTQRLKLVEQKLP